jgi:hypothetical protein
MGRMRMRLTNTHMSQQQVLLLPLLHTIAD